MSVSDRSQKLLNETLSYYNKKKYSFCIRSCQDILNYSPIKAELQSIIGLCYLNLNDINKAESYFQKSFELDPYLSHGLLGYAYIDLIKNRMNAALFKYTRLVKLKKEKRRSMRIINLIKKNSKENSFILRKNIHFFIPLRISIALSFRLSFLKNINFFGWLNKKNWKFVKVIFLLLFLFGLSYFLSKKLPYFKNTATDIQLRNDPLANIYLFETNIDSAKLSTKEIADSFEMMKKYIRSKRINEAIVLYNNIIQSDINLLLKEKFNLLYEFVPKPNFATFENTYLIEDQIGNNQFKNTYVKLVGIVSKFKNLNNDQVTFNFTLTEKRDLLHTMEVFLENPQNIYIKNNQQYELLAKYKGFDDRKKKAILNGLIIRESKR